MLHCEGETCTLIDYNRCGVPLIEIVTEPDIRSSGGGKGFCGYIKTILEYLEVSDCKMQEGSLVDVNVSVKPEGAIRDRTEMEPTIKINAARHRNEAARQWKKSGRAGRSQGDKTVG